MKRFIIKLLCSLVPIPSLRRKLRNRMLPPRKVIITEEMKRLDECIARLEYIELFLKNVTRVDSVPSASGNLELIQKASASILAKFAEVMNRNHAVWWLDSGSLIGYARHNGFVPWDDDCDVCMPREDYERLPELLSTDFLEEGFFFRNAEITRLYYKDLYIWIDVFPIDTGYSVEPPTGSEREEFINTLNEIKTHIQYEQIKRKRRERPVPAECIAYCKQERDSRLVKQKVPNGFLFFGVETRVRNRALFPHNWIFPLQPVNYLGIQAFAPNNIDAYLRAQYGDWLSWPPDFEATHDSFFTKAMLTPERIDQCRELIAKYYPAT